MARIAPPVLVVLALIAAWEAYARISGISPLILPSPSRILSALIDFREQALANTIPTVSETLVGYGVSVVGATAAAIVMDQSPLVRRAVYPLLVGSQTIPIIAVAPLLVIWFGFGLLPKVLVIVLVTFFPITVALLDGFASTDGQATDLLRTMGATRRQVFTKLRWPAALPSLFTGLRISVTYAVVAAIFAEYVGRLRGPRHLDADLAQRLPGRPRVRRDPHRHGPEHRPLRRGFLVGGPHHSVVSRVAAQELTGAC